MLEVGGVLHLQCQRCLGMLNHPLRLSSTLLLVSGGAAAADEFDAEDAEWIEASAALDVTGLIEDEVLLSLPYSPRHDEGLCRHGTDAMTADSAGRAVFAKLADLKRTSN